ncbi:ArnT family glycosyltransferase [Roseivirga sp.]|uniref:ArnT family glycosyltransferase n=1 Tax=Roseivirga sp. TaxID=1964215 RepID=UPI003B8B027F
MSFKKYITPKAYRTAQLALNLAFILIWYFANDGLAFWDDYTYLNFANQINDGTFEITTNHFTSRIGLLYPVAWLTDVFGVNQYTAALYPLLCGLIIMNLFFWIGERYGHWLGLIAGFLLLVDYHTITFTTHLFPEVPVALGIFGALFCYDIVNRREGDYRLLALLCATLIYGAFIIKTSMFIVGPLFVFLVVNDFLRRRNKGFWYITVSLLIFFFLIHGFWYKEMFGDFFYRFNNISDNHEPTVKTFFDKDSTQLIKRLTYLPFLAFIRGGFFIPLGFALPALFSIKRSDWNLDKPERLWSVAAILILISWWFISTNWKYYSPMPVETRHIMFIIPTLLMAGAHYWSENNLFQKVINGNLKWVVVAALLIIPAYKIVKSNDRNFSELSELIKTEFVDNNEAQNIIADGLVSYGHPYFYDFEVKDDTYMWWVELDFDQIALGDYLLVNPPFLNDRYEEPGFLNLLRNSIATKGWFLKQVGDYDAVELYQIAPQEE